MPAVPPQSPEAPKDPEAPEASELTDFFVMCEKLMVESYPASCKEIYEKRYVRELGKQQLSNDTYYKYAVSLIRSGNTSELHKGILILEDLVIANPRKNKDCNFFLSLAYARINQFVIALSFVDIYLMTCPGDPGILLWQTFLRQKMRKEVRAGALVATGSVMVIGGLIGLGIGLSMMIRQ